VIYFMITAFFNLQVFVTTRGSKTEKIKKLKGSKTVGDAERSTYKSRCDSSALRVFNTF
jgi:hypothetical protein